MEQQQLSKNQKRRRVDNANKSLMSIESNISTKPKTTTSADPDTSTEQTMPTKSDISTELVVTDGHKMASNDEYFLVCPRNKLCLLDTQREEHMNIKRDFDVNDICWSTYLK
jgi:hypothetical protein